MTKESADRDKQLAWLRVLEALRDALPKNCGACGVKLPDGVKFCRSCGAAATASGTQKSQKTAGASPGRISRRPAVSSTTNPHNGKLLAVSLLGGMVFLSLLCAWLIVENIGDDGEWRFWIPISMCAVAFCGHIFYLIDIARNWDDMSPADRNERTVHGIFYPPLFAIGSFITIAIGIVALVAWALASGGSSGGSSGPGSGPQHRDIRDKYGNRLGSLNTSTGDVRETGWNGRRVGSINPNTGEIKDRYGNRTGWLK